MIRWKSCVLEVFPTCVRPSPCPSKTSASTSCRVCRRGCPQLPLVTFRGLVLQDLLLELSVPLRMEDLVPRDHEHTDTLPRL